MSPVLTLAVTIAAQPARTSQALVSLVVTAGIVLLVMARRIRPQPVKPRRYLVFLVLIMAIAVYAIGSAATVFRQPLAIVLAVILLSVGAALGVVLVRTMRFWTDPATGLLWMQGGLLFVLIYVATLVVRFGGEYLAGGSAGFSGHVTAHGPVAILAVDLIFLSVGLWGARAFLLWQRWRAHQAGELVPGEITVADQ